MQYFQDTATGKQYAFEDSVIASKDSSGNYVFQYAESVSYVEQSMGSGTPTYKKVVTPLYLNVPATLQPCAQAVPTLDDLKSKQIGIVSMGCQQQIVGNFTSSALGAVYTYPSKPTDQANMDANVVSSLLPNLPANWTTQQMCADANGVWAYRAHTAAQIQQAGADGKAAILACLLKNDSLRSQINAITDPNPANPSTQTIAAIAAITW